MLEKKRFSLVKPGLETPFHIDFDWWKNHDSNWRVYLHNCLCPEHQSAFSETDQDSWIDWVDSQTGEVKQIDGLQNILIAHCAKQEGFITPNTALVDAVFRVLLASGNAPMNALELSTVIHKPAEMILRTLTGGTVYRGVRPLQNN
ncbi:MAG: hypothetical protein HPY59_10310 [Anaerolineae bacterium]|nr:hypothetical protein [Anaerolineae bacterium]